MALNELQEVIRRNGDVPVREGVPLPSPGLPVLEREVLRLLLDSFSKVFGLRGH